MRALNRFMNRQTGISLLEVMLSLSIIAIILVMATRYFFVASNNQNVNKVRGQIGTVVSALQEYRNQNPNYASVSLNVLVVGGFVPQNNDVSGSAGSYVLNNPWNSPITVTPTGSNNGATVSTVLQSDTDCKALAAGYATANGTCAGTGNTTFTVTVGQTT